MKVFPGLRADPTAGGYRPLECCCAWYLAGSAEAQYWTKGDDHVECPISSERHADAILAASRDVRPSWPWADEVQKPRR